MILSHFVGLGCIQKSLYSTEKKARQWRSITIDYTIHTDGTTAWSLFEKKYILSLPQSINQTEIAYSLFQSIAIMSLLLSNAFQFMFKAKLEMKESLKIILPSTNTFCCLWLITWGEFYHFFFLPDIEIYVS